MLDFVKIQEVPLTKKDCVEIIPEFIHSKRSKDIMVKGGDFYAIWDEKENTWSSEKSDAIRLIDEALDEFYQKNKEGYEHFGKKVTIKYAGVITKNNTTIDMFNKFLKEYQYQYKQLDTKITFLSDTPKKEDLSSKRLSYDIIKGPCDAFDEIVKTLYNKEEYTKFMWAMGSVLAGDSIDIQKFLVFYGSAGTGKSTIINIFEKLFDCYCYPFRAADLGNSNKDFAMEAFKYNPLVSIEHDGDLSCINDNTRLNSIISHENMLVNEKFKSLYKMKSNSLLVIGSNKPVKITDGRSGLLRRLIDIWPSGRLIESNRYDYLYSQLDYEIPAIAYKCKELYLKLGKKYYDKYEPTEMKDMTDHFYGFVEEELRDILDSNGGITLANSWKAYKDYCSDSNIAYPYNKTKFKQEMLLYFEDFEEAKKSGGTFLRNYYSGLKEKKKKNEKVKTENYIPEWLNLNSNKSIFDEECSECIAQYATVKETPSKRWDQCKDKLKEFDTSKLHYVRVPSNHIVLDFDIKGEDGKKNLQKNINAAAKFPKTYAELSKGGEGLHLHYIYDGDVEQLSNMYDENIEIKVFLGNSSLRRKLTKCNDISIAHISSGLPLKEKKKGDKMVNFEGIKNERMLISMIKKNLNKEYHAATKPSVDYIYSLLEDSYNSGIPYDVTVMRPAILAFAANSSNNSEYCLKLVNKMHFSSETVSETNDDDWSKEPIIFYDVEVFPNLFLINWKEIGEGKPVVRMINPKPKEVYELIQHRLVGFNCRRYDNHMLYARAQGYTNEELYRLSQRIVNSKKEDSKNCFFGEAYNISYTDIYDYSSKKQSLKKWEIELGIKHLELGLPWDEPVAEELWEKVAEYCDNDVISTEAVWYATQEDFRAREILVAICKHKGISACVNDTTNTLTTKIIFGNERKPKLVYTDLATGKQSDPEFQVTGIRGDFPGYEFVKGEDNKYHNMYRDEDVGKGGYVYAEPGCYGNVALLDIASMHPTSIEDMNMFGEYTKNYSDIKAARIHIKHKEYDIAKTLLDGAFAQFLGDEAQSAALSKSLKIPINAVYGLTSASFPNPFKDDRNDNNIVALRGALFMVNLKHEVQERGYTVVHIKTDSIKIADADNDIIDFVMSYGKEYGYNFEHEATYEKICLVNNAVYIARYSQDDVNGKHKGEWTATGTQFAVPYVFKSLFTKEPIIFDDYCETKEVSKKNAIYLDMNAKLPEGEHDYRFVGKVGNFVPVTDRIDGGLLVGEKDGKYDAVTGTKGYRWLESEVVRMNGREGDIDETYHQKLADDAKAEIEKYCDFNWFVNTPYTGEIIFKDEVPFKED